MAQIVRVCLSARIYTKPRHMKISNAPGRKNKRRMVADLLLRCQLNLIYNKEKIVGKGSGIIVAEEAERIDRIRKEIDILASRIVPKDVAIATKRKIYRGPK